MSKFVLFSNTKRKKILKDIQDIVDDKQAIKNFSEKKFLSALEGTFQHNKNLTKKAMYAEIMNNRERGSAQIIQEDSLTAWVNRATEQFGLEICDITAMKFGQKMKVILFDRNAGEYLDDSHKRGDKFNPRKEGLTYAEYIHGDGISGMLNMNDGENIHPSFTWEVNYGTKKCFWGPIECNDYRTLNPHTKVGWRGPSINLSDAKHLPNTVTFYNVWWNDYAPYRHSNYLKIKRSKD